jgi:acyl carrier protein
MTKEAMLSALQQELQQITSRQMAAAIAEDHHLSQIISSSGFLQLVLALELRLGITIEDEDFYEAAPVTVGDLISFLQQQVLVRRSKA